MSGLTSATGSSNRGARARYLRNLNSPGNSPLAKILAPGQRFFLDPEVLVRTSSVSYSPASQEFGLASSLGHRTFLDQQRVAVPPGGAKQFAPAGTHQQWSPIPEFAGSKGRCFDPRAPFGRPARGERMANPTPASDKYPGELRGGRPEKMKVFSETNPTMRRASSVAGHGLIGTFAPHAHRADYEQPVSNCRRLQADCATFDAKST
jgi:hypothetical protein